MADKKDDVLSLGVDLDVKGAIREMNRFQKEMGKQIGNISKKMGEFANANKKATKAGVKGTEDLTDAVEDLTEAYSAEAKVVKDLEKRLANSHGDEKKALEEELKLLREANKERQKASKGGKSKSGGFSPKSGKDIKKMWVEGAKDATDEFRSGIRAAFSKDLKGAVEGAFKGSSKTISTILTGSFSAAATGLFKGGKGLAKLGGGLSERGKQRGGGSGAAMQIAGGGLKAMGGIAGKIAPLIQMFSKLGPLVMTLSTAVMAVVKVFIDAEAQAKQFQKEILSSASTVEILAANSWDVDAGFGSLNRTMKEIRDAAFSLDNINWGITADEHKAVLNVLTQEGVSLNRITQEANISKKSVGDFAAELTHVSVAYSRAFGVPLQEINQLQAEMMTDLGMSLDETRLAFSQMTRAAADSGIAANKFFSIIRGVSQDLSLYNNRMEDAVHMLKMLGKVMNPREAQKFMSTAMQGLKNMGRQERLRLTLLTGSGKMAKLVERDTKRKQESIAKTISEGTGKSIEEVQDTLSKGGAAAVDALIKKLPDDKQGAIREGLTEIDLQKSRSKKGVFGVSGAAANMGPAASLQAMQSALAKWGGGSTLKEGAGTIGMEMMAENLGVSQEQLDHMIKFEGAIDRQRAVLLDQLKNGDDAAKDQAREALKRAGITAKDDKDLAKEIDKAGYDQIMDTLDEGAKEQLKNDSKVVDYTKKQSDLTQSLLDKLGVLVDFVMNQLYDIMVDIWEGVVSAIPDALKTNQQISRLEEVRNQKMAKKLGGNDASGKEVRDIISGGGSLDKFAKSETMKAWHKILDDWAATPDMTENDKIRQGELQSKSLGRKGLTSDEQTELDNLSKKAAAADKLNQAVVPVARTLGMERGSNESAADFANRLRNAPVGKTASGADMDISGIGDTAPTKDESLSAMTTIASHAGTLGYLKDDKAVDPKLFEASAKSAADTAGATDELAAKGARQKESLAVKFGSTFLGGKYKDTIEEAVLSAMRVALFEFYMYSEIEDRSEVANYLKNHPTMSPQDFSKTIGEGGLKGVVAHDTIGGTEAPANARGGLVTDVNGGLATVRAAAGEGLASVGRGERIVSSGGGGSGANVNVNVNGIGGRDLEQIIRAKVIDGIAEYKRRERFS